MKYVILHNCHSQGQVEASAQHIPSVIGLSQAIGDRAAIELAVGFYDALEEIKEQPRAAMSYSPSSLHFLLDFGIFSIARILRERKERFGNRTGRTIAVNFNTEFLAISPTISF